MTPQAMDPAHPFPFISNLSLNLLVTLRAPDDTELSLARVKVPVGLGIPRFLRVDGTRRFVRLEDVVAHNLDLLFPEARIDGYEFFRVTRNANTERDEDEADDLLALIESELRDRRFAPIVRMEALRGMNPAHRGMLAAELGLDEHDDVFEVNGGMLAMRDLMELTAVDNPGAARSAASSGGSRAAGALAQYFSRYSRRRLDPADASVRIVSDLGGTFPARGQRGSQGAGDQDDALPHLERFAK